MAFLCPVRIRRGKKKKSANNNDLDKEVSPAMGRITGSASIETLVRVGIEKEHGLAPDSKMVVLHDFTPCVDDELEVKRGQVVNILYRENDWVYVIDAETRQEGFMPHSYCAPYTSRAAQLLVQVKKKLPRDTTANGSSLEQGLDGTNDILQCIDTSDTDSLCKKSQTNIGATTSGTLTQNNANGSSTVIGSQASLHSEPDMYPFSKDPSGRYIVLYTFIARDENDVSVERGEFVTVLNREDPDWFWIVRSDGQEGFIPSGFVYPADNVIQGHLNSPSANNNQTTTQNNVSYIDNSNTTNITSVSQQQTNNISNNSHHNNSNVNSQQQETDLRYHGTELVMLYDYKAQAPDDLSVRRGDWIYADLSNQTVDGWLWAYSPKTRKYGFIPKAYARPPAMTSL